MTGSGFGGSLNGFSPCTGGGDRQEEEAGMLELYAAEPTQKLSLFRRPRRPPWADNERERTRLPSIRLRLAPRGLPKELLLRIAPPPLDGSSSEAELAGDWLSEEIPESWPLRR